MAGSWHAGLMVEGVTEASLTSDVFVACLCIHRGGGLGLVHQPVVRELASFQSRRTGLKEQGCVSGLEAVSPQVQFAERRRRGRPVM